MNPKNGFKGSSFPSFTNTSIDPRRIDPTHTHHTDVAGYDAYTQTATAPAKPQAMLRPATALLPLLLILTIYAQPEYRVPATWTPWIDHLAFDSEASRESF